MRPIICTIGPFNVYSYGLMLAAAFLLSVTLAQAQAKKEKIDPAAIFDLAFLSFICGVLGARIFYIAENIGYYLRWPLEIIMLQRGGLSWFGGLILGAACGIAYLKKKGLPFYLALDLISPFVALAQSIGRIGCLLNGCCFGRPSLRGIYFNVHEASLIPTQLYSSLALLLIFAVLRLLQDKPHRRGEIFFCYLLFYSLKRFLIEFWRADNPAVIYGLSLFQLLSLALFLFSLVKLSMLRNEKLLK